MRRRGFNLIEVMIVVVLIAIASSFAYSSYRKSVIRGRTGQVQPCITDAALRLENYRSNYGAYPTETGTDLMDVLGVDVECGDYYQGAIIINGNRWMVIYSDSRKSISGGHAAGTDVWAITDQSTKLLHVGNPVGTDDPYPTGYSASGPN